MDEKEGFGSTGEAAAKKARTEHCPELEALEDEDVWQAVIDMEKARAASHVEVDAPEDEFTCHIRGGTRNFLKTGSAPDSVQAFNRSDVGG